MTTELPNGWTLAALSDVCAKIADGTHHSPPNSPVGEYRYVTAKNIRRDGIDLSDITYINAAAHEQIYARCPVEEGDVLYIKDGATTGLAAVNTISEPFSLLSSVALLKVHSRVLDARYLKYWLNSRDTFALMTSRMTGSAIRRLTLTTISSQIIPLPPLPEQRRIVARIEALFARTRRARTDLERIAPLAKRYKERLRAQAFNGSVDRHHRAQGEDFAVPAYTPPSRFEELPSISLPWKWAEVGSISTVAEGLTKNQQRAEQPIEMPYLRVANVYADDLRLDSIETIRVSSAEYKRVALEAGDLLVVEGNGSVDQIGRVAVWDGSLPICGHQNHLIRVRAREGIPPRYLLHWLMSPYGRSVLEAVASSSSGLHTLSLSKVCAIPVPVPPSRVASDIVAYLDTSLAAIGRAGNDATRALALLDHLEQSILARAFRGELVPQDEADEPASAMIARLQKTQSRAANSGRRGRWSA